MKAAYQMIDPYSPPGQPGSYARGHHNGIADALRQLRANLEFEYRRSPEPAGTAPFNVTRYKVVQDKGEYCLKGCPDGDLVDFSAYAALLNGCTTPTKEGSES